MPRKSSTRRTSRHHKPRYQKLTVTDHALVQYFVRVMGLNLESAYTAILPPETQAQVLEGGDGAYPTDYGHAVVRGGKVVTILI